MNSAERDVQSGLSQSMSSDYDSYRTGAGNWDACNIPLDVLCAAAERWQPILDSVARPWLCWNVDPDWCLVQQRLALEVGWTPLVGGDPRLPRPILLPNSLYIDFNAEFRLPTMFMHFPLEFAFAFAGRLAFWHSDLLV